MDYILISTMSTIKAQFDLTSETVKLCKSVSDEEKLSLYGLYKQINDGDCKKSEPSKLFNYTENLKWNAWNKNKGMTKEEAMKKYVNIATSVINKNNK